LQHVPVAPKDDFKTALVVSVLLHLIIASVFLIKVIFFSKPLIDLSQAISVSVADFSDAQKLPEKRTAPAPAEEKPAEPVKEEAEEPPAKIEKSKPEPLPKKNKPPEVKEEINLSKSKSKQKQALERIKKLSALDKIKQDVSSETAKAGAKKKPYVVAAGSQLSGLDKIEAAEYLQSLDASIKQFWQLPQWLANKNLRAQVLVKFNTAGQLLSTKVLTSSGNSTYDNYCLQAITKAAPFPKVPSKFSEKFSVDGLVVGFPE
jgi:colicin import membrane protein